MTSRKLSTSSHSARMARIVSSVNEYAKSAVTVPLRQGFR